MDRIALPRVFRYSAPAHRRALVLFVALVAAIAALTAILLGSWSQWGISTRFVALLLLLGLLVASREQSARLWWRLIINADGVKVAAPLRTREFRWSSILEVQRIDMPRIGRHNSRWICAILTPGRSGINRRYYLFDSDIEDAGVALEFIYHCSSGARTQEREGQK